MPRLHLIIDQDPNALDRRVRRPFDLSATPLRPGIGHEELVLSLDVAVVQRVEELASAAGLPAGAWAGVVIEAERALSAVGSEDGSTLAEVLDLVAAREPMVLLAQRHRRLVRYGLALRSASPRPAETVRESLQVVAAQQSVIAWELAAAAADQTVERWAVEMLLALPAGRELWEAASAIAGISLGEWVAVQAARRSSA